MSTLFLTGYDQTQAISQTSICRFAITSLLADVRWRAHTLTYAIDRLTDIDRHFVKIAEYIATDFVRQLAKGFATERKVDRHWLFRRDRLEIPVRVQERLKDVSCDMPHDGDTDAVTTNVIGFVIACGQHVIVA